MHVRFAVMSLGVSLIACSPAPVEGCKKDTDCKGTRVCVNAVCQDAASAGGGSGGLGGGSAAGGGSAVTGGGAAASGGGTASSGGGSAVSGGGTASSGGGGASSSQGGGSVSTGGGTPAGGGSAGGGSSTTGGGTAAGGGTPTATFYVSPTGNDSTGTGSQSAPWRTLGKAAQSVSMPGALIRVLAGTYTENATVNLATKVSLEGDGPGQTIIRGGMTGDWSTLLQLESLQDTDGAQSISNLTLDGQYVSASNFKTWVGVWVTGRSNVTIHHVTVTAFKDRGVIYDGNDGSDHKSDPGHYATGNSFHDNVMTNCADHDGIYGRGQLNIGGQLGMEIFNNTFTSNQRPTWHNGWPIKYWDDGWLKGVRIHHNTLVKAPYVGSYPGENGEWDFALELFNNFGVEIDHNTVQGSLDFNYNRKGSYAHSVWVHDNRIEHVTPNTNTEMGIIFEFATQSALVENNVINHQSTGVQFNTRSVTDRGGYDPVVPAPTLGYSECTDNVIRNNQITNLYRGAGVGGSGGVLIVSEGTNDPQVSNLQIYNNTFTAVTGSAAPFIGIDFSSQENGNATGVFIRNNIFTGFQDAWVTGSTPNTRMTNVVITHNAVSANANNNAPRWPGGNPGTYTYSNNLTTAPQFVSATDFHLQTGSALINAGVDVGLPFLGTAPDIGCYEMQ